MDLSLTIVDGLGNVLYGPDVQTNVPVDPDERLFAAIGAGTGGDVPASILQGNNTSFISVEVITPALGVE